MSTAQTAGELVPDLAPDLSNVVTEDDEPVDGVFSEKQQRLLTTPLLECWSGPPGLGGTHRPFIAMANVGLFFSATEPPLVPDAMVSVDVEQRPNPFPKEGRSYFVWVYGKVPDVVIEVVSNRDGGELSERLRRYERIRVAFYVVYDPEHHLAEQDVHSFVYAGGAYTARESLRFEPIGLQLVRWEGTFERLHGCWLRWAMLDGTLVPTPAEQMARADEETRRAEAEEQRAEAEKQRAEAEKQRADALAARLRALGVDPSEM